MPSVHTSLTINAPPSSVREVFLDWANYEWSKAMLNKITITKSEKAPLDLVEGDALKVVTPGMTFEPFVLVNTPSEFTWQGGAPVPGLFAGQHKFEFLPKDGDANQTLLVQSEDLWGVLSFIAGPTWKIGKWMKKDFESFNGELKEEVEKRQELGKEGVAKL